jgi:LysM repeat protein
MGYVRALRGRLAIASLSSVLVASCFAQHVRADQTRYVIQPNDTLSSIAAHFGTSVSALMAANHIANASYIQTGETLIIGASAKTPAQTAMQPATSTSASSVYVVQLGDTLSAIGQHFGVALADIANANSLADPYVIRAGQQLTIPATADSPAPAAQVSTASATAASTTSGSVYVVQPGDTLSGIASQFGASADTIAATNHISVGDFITVGQRLDVPTTAAAPTSSSASGTTAPGTPASQAYVVQPGDTLSAIASRYSTTPDALATENSIAADSLIRVGQQLSVPAASQGPSVSQSAIGDILTSEAQAAGIDAGLVKAVAWQESGWQMITAEDGGIGVMQLMPDSVDWAGNILLGYTINPYDPTQNIRAGVAMLRYYLSVYPDVPHALAAYHQGMASVDNAGYQNDTVGYIANVLALQQRFGG